MYAGDALLQAIGTALAGNITGGVHELEAPQGTAYPYTVIDSPTEVPDDLHDGEGGEYTVTLHVFSDAENLGEANGILAEIDGLMHHASLSVSGVHAWSSEREFTGPVGGSEENGRPITHLAARYRINLEET